LPPVSDKNSLAILVRVMDQAVRDGIIDRNPARVTGWQHAYRLAEDELDDPRSLAVADWESLVRLAQTLVPGWTYRQRHQGQAGAGGTADHRNAASDRCPARPGNRRAR
jgi:hypothetical protein